jgi:hypothetical protein
MRKFLLASVALFGLATPILTSNAIAASNDQRVASSEVQIQRMQEPQSLMLDAHLAGMRDGLKLTDEQAKNWPAFESAIRGAEKARSDRWRQARERMSGGDRPSTIERMTIMSDHLQKMADQLNKVAEASKPLYDSLTDVQKREFDTLIREFRPHDR